MSAIDAYSQNEATPGPSHAASKEARAALWTGIIGAAKHIGKREPLQAARRPLVVQLKPGIATTPVYFIGAGLFEFHLAQLISSEQSVYAVEIAWPSAWHDAAIANDTASCPTLEQLTAPYAAAIRAHAGASPCVLIGYSFNGNIAFEAAHQLQDARQQGRNRDAARYARGISVLVQRRVEKPPRNLAPRFATDTPQSICRETRKFLAWWRRGHCSRSANWPNRGFSSQ
jgi:hypothetical protein